MNGIDVPVTGVKAGLGGFDPVSNPPADPTPPEFPPARADQVTFQRGGSSFAGFQILFSAGPVDPAQGFGLAVRGVGFFQLDTPQGLRLTRGGGFHLDASGDLVSSQGLPVTPPVQVPADAQSILVTNDGRVLALLGDGSVVLVGMIELASVPNPGGLVQEGEALFAPSAASGAPLPGAPGQIQFAALEGSSTGVGSAGLVALTGPSGARANLPPVRIQEPPQGAVVDILG
jgi:flagellar basal-body rod protein FlgG